MSECFYEVRENGSIGRKSMGHLPTFVFFLDKSCLHEATRMFGHGLDVAIEFRSYFFQRYSFIAFYHEQNGNTIMVCNTLEVTLELLTGL
jgi:hypothetical protein